MFKSSPDNIDQGGKYVFFVLYRVAYFGEDHRTSNSQCFFFSISFGAWMAMADAVLALVWK